MFAEYARRHPYDLQIIAVAEPDEGRRTRLANMHQIPAERQFETWEALLDHPKVADAAIITTMDRLHFLPAKRALELGYEVLLEKPMSPVPEECIRLAAYAEAKGRILTICHSLRYTPFFQMIKSLVENGVIGRLMSIQHTENVGYWHQAHSFVRGNWRNVAGSSPMLLSKSCHDIDVLYWLVGSECRRVSSFGALSYFRPENAPAGAPGRCTEGCPVEDTCPYSALKIYLRPGAMFAGERFNGDWERAYKALHESPYSRCVFRCDNDVVDHQVVNMEFASGATVAFTMCAFSHEVTRTIKVFGTDGEIRGHMERGELEVTRFRDGSKQIHRVIAHGGHAGGDDALAHSFVQQLRSGTVDGLTSGRVSALTHLITFAAEEARVTGQVVDVHEYVQAVTERALLCGSEPGQSSADPSRIGGTEKEVV